MQRLLPYLFALFLIGIAPAQEPPPVTDATELTVEDLKKPEPQVEDPANEATEDFKAEAVIGEKKQKSRDRKPPRKDRTTTPYIRTDCTVAKGQTHDEIVI